MNDIELFAENDLSPIEAEEREFHERVIHDAERGKKKLTEIQLASLKVLFDQKLYRSTHKTFPEYCKATFDFEKAYSYFQIGFAQVKENLSTRVDFLPATEGQARPLAALKSPELQAQAWTQAQADSGKEQPSNREVAEAVAKVQAELDAEKQRTEEFRIESNERRKRIREMEEQIDLLTTRDRMMQGRLEKADEEIKYLATVIPDPVKIEVLPADYETAKAKAAELERELAKVKDEQATLINNQVKAKLREYQSEVDEMEQRKEMLQEQVDRMKTYMASLESDAKRAEVHQSVINGVRLELINLAAFLNDEESIQDTETLKRWRALANMLGEAMTAIHQYIGDAKPQLTVIPGGAA